MLVCSFVRSASVLSIGQARSGFGWSRLQRGGNGLELSEGGGEVLDDLSGDDLRRREVVGVFDGFVP